MSKYLKCAALALILSVAPAIAEPIGLGRPARPEEIKAWNIDVRPDGLGLPPGKGTVAQGDVLFQTNCATCHGEFGQGNGRWPELAGGQDTLKDDRPLKTVGSYWPHLTTVYDYINRAMPYGSAHTLQPNEVYALTAYILYLNDIVKEQDFELNEENLASVAMPNAAGFREDDRETAEKQFWGTTPCMKDCKSDVKITSHAAVLDVTPDKKDGGKLE